MGLVADGDEGLQFPGMGIKPSATTVLLAIVLL